MTKNDVEKMLPILKAWVNGETIQVLKYKDNLVWTDIGPNSDVDFEFGLDYRIKPKKKYQPFTSLLDCLEEIREHKNLCVLMMENFPVDIINLSDSGVIVKMRKTNSTTCLTYPSALEKYKFTDGTPFGKLEEE
jgi:hypothetical protein